MSCWIRDRLVESVGKKYPWTYELVYGDCWKGCNASGDTEHCTREPLLRYLEALPLSAFVWDYGVHTFHFLEKNLGRAKALLVMEDIKNLPDPGTTTPWDANPTSWGDTIKGIDLRPERVYLRFEGSCKGTTEGLPYSVGGYNTVANGPGDFFLMSTLPMGSIVEFKSNPYKVVRNYFSRGDLRVFSEHLITLELTERAQG